MSHDIDLVKRDQSVDIEVHNKHGNIDVEVKKGTSGGTNNYDLLRNKPQIEGVTLEGDKSFKQLGMDTLSVQEIEKILYLD